jgi:transposase
LFHQWHRRRECQISRQELQAITTPIRQALETTVREVSDLGFAKGEKTPWASTVRTCRQILNVAPAMAFLVEAWEAHKTGQLAPSLLPQRD